MKKLDIAICGAMLVLCGCGPELAQVNCGAEEADWSRNISNSYPGYKAPRMAPPAIADNVSPRLVKEEETRMAQSQEDVPATDVPEAAADDLASEPAVQEIPQEQKPAVAETESPNVSEKPSEQSTENAMKQTSADADKGKTKDGVATAQSGEFEVYEVRPGDTLGAIAKKFYGSANKYDVIMRANKIEDPTRIRIGTKLSIPKL